MPTASLNEIEALARKAARGAGMSWGLAEEAGKAARWLAARGLPALPSLAALLDAQDGLPYQVVRPQEETAADGALRWRAAGERLCPIACGAALADRAGDPAAGLSLKLERVAQPLLLLPFLARAADQRSGAIALSLDGWEIRVGPDGPDDAAALAAAPAEASARLRPLDRPVAAARAAPGAAGFEAPDDAWETLARFAHRTYVPASDESRLAGAGAGLSDND